MTWTLGVFGGNTSFQKNRFLKDGNACLFKNGEIICSIAEERLSRNRHDGKFEKSIDYCLSYAGIDISDIDLAVFSNCCDQPLNKQSMSSFIIDPDIIYNISSHHLSHAYLAYKMSEFDSGFIVVMDNEGNILGEKINSEFYWKNDLERNSYYSINNGLKLIGRDCDKSNEIGVGDSYHYFTHFLGWNSYTLAGRVMGLSGYGNEKRYNDVEIFNIDVSGNIICNISNNRVNKEQEIINLGRKYGIDFGKPRNAGSEITQNHRDIAALIQKSIENILKRKISKLLSNSSPSNLCFSGGVAYNCLLNRILLDLPEVDKLHIPFCPGDEGQSIGNAMWGLHKIQWNKIGSAIRSPFLGKDYSSNEIENELIKYRGIVDWEESKDFISQTAEYLSHGKVVAWFQGRSETGRRALGNRSILADPRNYWIKDKLNQIKGRERFRPYSPTILENYIEDYYDRKIYSPYMSISAFANDRAKKEIQGVVHTDGTSRIQTLSSDFNPLFYTLICKFRDITQIPMLLNTSFNYNGEPIVESPSDAIKAFLHMNIDVLVMERYIVKKRG